MLSRCLQCWPKSWNPHSDLESDHIQRDHIQRDYIQRMRVVFVVLDSMPHAAINAGDTPRICEQIAHGGWALTGATSLPVSVTYSNLAAFATGLDPARSGLWGNHAWSPEHDRFVPTYELGPRGSTIIDRCAAAGLSTMAIAGDVSVLTTMVGRSLDAMSPGRRWPAGSGYPEGTPLDGYGYAANAAVIGAAQSLGLDADFVLLHLNEPDTTLHIHGPESPEATARFREVDASYGALVDQLAAGWSDTVLITVSDHCQEQIDPGQCIDLAAWAAETGWGVAIHHDGTAAVIHERDNAASPTDEDLLAVPGVEAVERLSGDTRAAYSAPRRMFGRGAVPTLGNHGGPRCRSQLAVVSGGHSAVPELAAMVAQEPIGTLTWAPLIAELLTLDERGSA